MLPIKRLSENISAAGWLTPSDFTGIKSLGFDKVVNFRPDNEVRGQETSAESQSAAEAAGLEYVHIPVTKHDLFTDEIIGRALKEFGANQKVLGYCASGQRVAIVWAAGAARSTPVDGILSSLHDAGFDLGFIRDALEAQADRARWSEGEVQPETQPTAEGGKKGLEAAA